MKKIQQIKYNSDLFLNQFFNSYFRTTFKQIKESIVNVYLIVFFISLQNPNLKEKNG